MSSANGPREARVSKPSQESGTSSRSPSTAHLETRRTTRGTILTPAVHTRHFRSTSPVKSGLSKPDTENEPRLGQSANGTEDYLVAKVNTSKLLGGAEEGGSLCYVSMKEASRKPISK